MRPQELIVALTALLADTRVHQAVEILAPHVSVFGHHRPTQKLQSAFEQPRKPPGKENRIVADANSVLQHLGKALGSTRPRGDVGRSLETDLLSAIWHVASFSKSPDDLAHHRTNVLRDISHAKSIVAPVTAAIHAWLPDYAKPIDFHC